MEQYKKITEDFQKNEEIIKEVNEEVQELLENQNRLETRIQELENQETFDDNGTSIAMEIMKAKEDLEDVKNRLGFILEKDTNHSKDALINHIDDFKN